MRNVIVTVVVLVAMGCSSPGGLLLPVTQAGARDDSTRPLSSGACELRLATFASQPADTTPTAGGICFRLVSLAYDWPLVDQRVRFAVPFLKCRTLLSQHVLLRL
ncbi:hypothetical protein [Aeoliella mucimassa]|nr:hypothetical protein [Aeoliella mucimassa]